MQKQENFSSQIAETRKSILVRSSNPNIIWIPVYIVVVSLLLFQIFSDWAYDDPYITYRYSQNLINGTGFVYNANERVLSTTTPLFALLLACLAPLWDNLPKLANLIGTISLAVGAVFIWDLAKTWKSPPIGWAGLLLYPSFPLMLTTIGSETPLYLALCLGSFATYARRSFKLTAILSALALLTRPDGILVVIILSIDFLIRIRRPIPWVAVLLFLGITIPWFTFAWIYFGSPIPATLVTKQQQGLMTISQRFPAGFVSLIKQYVRKFNYRIEAALVILGGGYLGIESYRNKNFRRWLLFFGWIVLYFLAYTALGVSRYFWYYAPLIPGIVGLVGLGAASVVLSAFVFQRLLFKQQFRNNKNINFTSIANVLVVLLIAFLALFQFRDLYNLRSSSDKRIDIYRAIGEWFQANTPPDTTIGTLEVGIIGYYSQRHMVDFAGLLIPDIAAQFSNEKHYDDAALWAAREYQPNYIVIHEGTLPTLQEQYIKPDCDLLQTFIGQKYGFTNNMYIYQCNK